MFKCIFLPKSILVTNRKYKASHLNQSFTFGVNLSSVACFYCRTQKSNNIFPPNNCNKKRTKKKPKWKVGWAADIKFLFIVNNSSVAKVQTIEKKKEKIHALLTLKRKPIDLPNKDSRPVSKLKKRQLRQFFFFCYMENFLTHALSHSCLCP